MKRILVIEDGSEYEEFARLFLADACEVRAAHSAAEALALLDENPADVIPSRTVSRMQKRMIGRVRLICISNMADS